MGFGISREERLKKRKLITTVFQQGTSVKGYPLLAVYYHAPDLAVPRPQVAFSVPKRKIKTAVKRNLLKRRMREAYRLHRSVLATTAAANTAIMFIYLPAQPLKYADIEKGMAKILAKIEGDNATRV